MLKLSITGRRARATLALSAVGVTLAGVAVMCGLASRTHHRAPASPVAKMVAAYGGLPLTAPITKNEPKRGVIVTPKSDPLMPLLSLYGKGRYADVETASVPYLAEGAKPQASLPTRKAAVRARHLIAFAAARRHDMKTAQARFAQAKVEAAKLPQGGAIRYAASSRRTTFSQS